MSSPSNPLHTATPGTGSALRRQVRNCAMEEPALSGPLDVRVAVAENLACHLGAAKHGARWLILVPSVGLALLTAAVASLVLGCKREGAAESAPEPAVSGDTLAFATNAPELASLTIERAVAEVPGSLSLPGRLICDEDATARIFSPFTGIVRKLFVDLNQQVKQGEPLAEILSPDYGQAQSDALKAGIATRLAQRNLARLKDLFEHGAAPRKDLEAAEADFDAAKAEQGRAVARLAIYGAAPGATDQDFILPCPISGTLVERSVTPGQEVRPDQMLANLPQITEPLFIVTDPSRLWVQIDATETELPRLSLGQEIRFTTRAFPGQTFSAQIEKISELIDPTTRTIKVRGKVANDRRLLKAGMFVSVTLHDEQSAGVRVPAKAVFLKGDKHYVFIQERPGRFVRREVTMGEEQEGRVSVLEGLQAGQLVVTDGCILLDQEMKQ